MTVAALFFYYLASLSLGAVAVVQVVSLVASLRDRRAVRESAHASHIADQYVGPSEYVPMACGLAASCGDLTSECLRRRGHTGRCVSELEIDQLLDKPTRATISAPTDVMVDVAALGRHVDLCPSRLTDEGVLSYEEQQWLIRTRLMVESLVSGEKFSEWGETRG